MATFTKEAIFPIKPNYPEFSKRNQQFLGWIDIAVFLLIFCSALGLE